MKESPTQEITALHLDFSKHSTRISCNKKSPKHRWKYQPCERGRISLSPSLIFLQSPGTSSSRLQISLETHSIPGMDAWHIRVQHAAPRYHIGSAKEYDRNHNHSCPFVTWAFRQPQALAQLAVKPFWQCQ